MTSNSQHHNHRDNLHYHICHYQNDHNDDIHLIKWKLNELCPTNPPTGTLRPTRAPSLTLHHHSEKITVINISLKMGSKAFITRSPADFQGLGWPGVKNLGILVDHTASRKTQSQKSLKSSECPLNRTSFATWQWSTPLLSTGMGAHLDKTHCQLV